MMAITTKIDSTTGARLHKVTGRLQLEELRNALKAVYEGEDFDPGKDVLWDLQDADLTAFSSADIKHISGLVKQHWGKSSSSRAALVVSRDVDFGLARMYEQLLDTGSTGVVRVFRDYEKAIDWLTS
jgi:hypothetical protein